MPQLVAPSDLRLRFAVVRHICARIELTPPRSVAQRSAVQCQQAELSPCAFGCCATGSIGRATRTCPTAVRIRRPALSARSPCGPTCAAGYTAQRTDLPFRRMPSAVDALGLSQLCVWSAVGEGKAALPHGRNPMRCLRTVVDPLAPRLCGGTDGDSAWGVLGLLVAQRPILSLPSRAGKSFTPITATPTRSSR